MACSKFDFEDEMRIVLLGKTGSGKSATGNCILNFKVFKDEVGGSSVTKRCSRSCAYRFGKNIHVVDTPGMFDTQTPNDKVLQEIAKCTIITSPGPHAFILVLSVRSRFSPEERETIEKFLLFFGEEMLKYSIVIFTGKDDLERHNLNEEEYVSKVPDTLKDILKKCNNRYIFFDNFAIEEKKNQQVQCLFDLINRNISENDSYFSNADYEAIEKAIQKLEAEKEKEQNAHKNTREQIRHEVEVENLITLEAILKIVQVVGEIIIRGLELYLKLKHDP